MDPRVSQSYTPDPAVPGEEVLYTFDIRNLGPMTATSVQLSDSIPSGTSFVSASADQGSCNHSGGTVTCSIGSLANNATTRARVRVSVPPDKRGNLSNTGQITTYDYDLDSSNNSATAAGELYPRADVSVTRSSGQSSVVVGSPVSYVFTVSNAGPSSADGVTFQHYMPANVAFGSVVPSPSGQCSYPGGLGGLISCNLGTIGKNGAVTLTVNGTAVNVNTLPVQASVTTAATDPNPANNNNNAQGATITVTATACSPRPKVTVSAVNVGGGRLRATVTTTPPPGSSSNAVGQIRLNTFTNAIVEINGQTYTSGNVDIFYANRPSQVTFDVRRAVAGQATIVPFNVIDDCGPNVPWNTFVGGGPSAF